MSETTEQWATTCWDVVQEMIRDTDVDICLPGGWVSVCRDDPDDGDRVIGVTDDILRVPPAESRMLASALIGQDVENLIALAEAARDWREEDAETDSQPREAEDRAFGATTRLVEAIDALDAGKEEPHGD